MSAYLVPHEQIDVIVSFFVGIGHDDGLWCEIDGQWQYLKEPMAKYIAYELYLENCRSLNHRYNEFNDDEQYNFTYYRQVRTVYHPLEIAGAIDGLEYQSCEREDYHDSKAYQLLHLMRKHLLRSMAESKLGENTVWSIDEVRTADRLYI